jgi:beta-glucosidase
MMTSYNLVNGIHSANSADLCTRVAREEFGFDGFIMTDWTTTEQGDDCTAAGCILAGNDMVMPGQFSDHESIRRALKSGALKEEQLRACVERIVRVILKSDCYE